MRDTFITKIKINKVRHLQEIEIPLSDDKKKHLILTGKNGSGKTSLIQSLSSVFIQGERFIKYEWERLENSAVFYNTFQSGKLPDVTVFCTGQNVNNTSYPLTSIHVDTIFHTITADRKLSLQIPKSIEAVDVEQYGIQSDIFLKYLLYLNYQRINAITNNDSSEANKVQRWFDMFVGALRDIYDCPELELIHNSKDLSYKIILPDHEPFGLNEMADGYSSFLYIVIELIMKMEKETSVIYDMPGIVLIDEIETHLHVEMQKRILPFLTKMFPRVQFIVTTHSPFVINSIPNAVVYDLEKKIFVEDMSAYSYKAVIEHFYDVNMYSIEANKQFEIYKSLVEEENPTSDEVEQLINSITYLKQIPAGAAKELVYSFREMEARRRSKMNGQA